MQSNLNTLFPNDTVLISLRNFLGVGAATLYIHALLCSLSIVFDPADNKVKSVA